MSRGDLRIDGAVVVPMDGPPDAPLGDVRTASIRSRGDRIAEIGDLQPSAGEATLEAHGLVALPGFVQTHVHFCQTLFRGLADDLPLLDWLRRRIWPLEAAHDTASVRASAELSVLELLLSGTTTVQVMESVRHTEESFLVAQRSGMTAILGNCLMDVAGPGAPPGLTMGAGEAIRHCEELRAAFDGVGRLHYAVSPRFLLSCSDDLSEAAAGYAAQHGLRIHTHACEHPAEIEKVRRATGTSYLAALHRQGLLGSRTGLAHCVHTTAAERQLLIDSGCAVLHCPSANLKLGSGVAPIARYRQAGLRVGLGADGAACNNRLSALAELRLAALLQAAHAGPGAWPAPAALFAATRGGAEALDLAAEVGSLEIGKRADIALLDLGALGALGALGGDPAASVVYAASDAHVRHVVLGGEVVVRDGTYLAGDAGAIRAHARAAQRAVLARAGL